MLRLYDEEVRPSPTDDFRDVANAVSLLWRLEEHGVAVGERWDELREIALRRRRDMTLAFAALHNLLALVATGEIDAAWDLVRAMEDHADGRETDQAVVMERVAIYLAHIILDLALHRASSGSFASLVMRLPVIGGSNAQRDVFVRALAALLPPTGATARPWTKSSRSAAALSATTASFPCSTVASRLPHAERPTHHKHLELT